MSKIKRITVSNLKAVSKLQADFNGCTAIITGGNNKGKSSFLKSLPERIRGNKPDVILKHGEKDGFAEWELTTGEKFVWTFDGKKEKLTFISERNIPSSVSKELGKHYFPPVFDVDEFLNSTPQKQRKVLQELTGIDFSEFDKMYKEAYEARTYANKRRDEEKAKLGYVDPKIPTTETPTEDIEKKLNSIEVRNLKVDTVEKQISDLEDKVNDNLCEIENLENKIAALKKQNEDYQKEITNHEQWMRIADNKRIDEDQKQKLKSQLEELKKANLQIVENNKAIEQQTLYEKAVKSAEAADEEVKRIVAEKDDVIKNASMPEGFGFSDEGITYKGFDFNKEQLSSSAVYIAALKLAAIGLGEVKTLHFDASFLDKKSLQDIEDWAKQNDLQLLIERPDFEGGEIEYQLIQG